MEKKSNHRTNVIRVSEILPHTNADSLELIHVGEYQVVVRKNQFKAGDLAVYIQPDSVVPQTEPFKFIWELYQTVNALGSDPALIDTTVTVPERRRRITVRKFRKEWSEGLLLPLTDFFVSNGDGQWFLPDIGGGEMLVDVTEGTDVSDLLGITHYDPDKGRESTGGDNTAGPKYRRWPRSFKGWCYFLLQKIGINLTGNTQGWDKQRVDFDLPVYDVEALKNFANAFIPGQLVTVTEKIHGSNARFVFLKGTMYAGSRTLWKSPKSKCVWRKALAQLPWIEEWCRANEGFALYGEVVPTQKGFDYGCKDGEVKFFVFDIRTPEGTWIDSQEFTLSGEGVFPSWVPFIGSQGKRFEGSQPFQPFDLDTIKKIADGPSLIPGAAHIREGVVVRPLTEQHIHGLGRLQLKFVSNAFLEKDTK